jgi:hypothetical protein
MVEGEGGVDPSTSSGQVCGEPVEPSPLTPYPLPPGERRYLVGLFSRQFLQRDQEGVMKHMTDGEAR